jgi:hypothetical protein
MSYTDTQDRTNQMERFNREATQKVTSQVENQWEDITSKGWKVYQDWLDYTQSFMTASLPILRVLTNLQDDKGGRQEVKRDQNLDRVQYQGLDQEEDDRKRDFGIRMDRLERRMNQDTQKNGDDTDTDQLRDQIRKAQDRTREMVEKKVQKITDQFQDQIKDQANRQDRMEKLLEKLVEHAGNGFQADFDRNFTDQEQNQEQHQDQ